MMSDPLVSVIIPNYNYSKYLREAIDSALAQTYSNIEIIVVDDGSEDSSRAVIESYENKIKAVFQKNQGVAAARNNGVAASTGEFVAFLDADDVWYPQKIERQVARFELDTDLGLVHVGVREVDACGQELNVCLDGMEGRVCRELLLFERAVILGGGSGLMLPRRVFEEIDGFDLRLSTSADWDVYFQVSSRYPVGFVPDVLLKYRIHSSNMHSNIRRMESDTLIIWQKAFIGASDDLLSIRSAAYGNLYKVLAGSYLKNGQYIGFIRNLLRSICHSPSHLSYYLRLLAKGRTSDVKD